jgi:TRAP-type C4-dicarboxylate transport system permease small subunit
MNAGRPAGTEVTSLERRLGWVLVAIMAMSVVNVLWQVFTRFVLSDPSSYTEELARYLLIWIGLLGAAYASGRRMHLAIDLLPRRLKGARKAALAVIVRVCVLAFALAVLVAGGLRLVLLTLRLGQRSAALGVPIGLVYMALPVSGVLIAGFAIRDIRRIVRREAPE